MASCPNVNHDAEIDNEATQSPVILACLPHAHHEILDASVLLVSAAVVLVGAVALAVFGPIGIDDSLGPARRLAFVATCSALCWPLCHSLGACILRFARHLPPRQIALACTGGVLFSTVPCTAIVFTTYCIFEPEVAVQIGIGHTYLNVTVAVIPYSLLIYYSACLRVRLRGSALSRAGTDTAAGIANPPTLPAAGNPATAQHHDSAAGVLPAQIRFLDRLPDVAGRDVVYLHVHGHYIDVVTATGTHSLLMRFADAVAELGGLGIQVHRSYWCALRHVTAAVRQDERTVLRVTGGHEVPVSRTYLNAVRAAIPNSGDSGDGTSG
jgi:hypothetical protein